MTEREMMRIERMTAAELDEYLMLAGQADLSTLRHDVARLCQLVAASAIGGQPAPRGPHRGAGSRTA